MNLQKAIELLKLNLKEAGRSMPPDIYQALVLSIEAIEFFENFQKVTGGHQDARLPSETED